MEKLSKGRNVYLDLFKIFLSFLVIAIHVTEERYPHFPLYRIAVPILNGGLLKWRNIFTGLFVTAVSKK